MIPKSKLLLASAFFACLVLFVSFADAAQSSNSPGPLYGSWLRVVDHAAFSPRDTASGVLFLGKMWISNAYPERDRDLWSSDDGALWTKVLDETPYETFSRLVVHDGKLWALKNSVWSSDNGVDWVQVVERLPFSALGTVVVHAGRMWHLGAGQEVWSSGDGVNWTCARRKAPFGNRSASAVTVFDGKLWLMGGSTPAPGKGYPSVGKKGYPNIDMNNDVWSSIDGRNWTLVTGHAPWKGRMWFASQAYAGRLWIMAGYDNDAYTNLSDVWYTSDGDRWQELKPGPSWPARHDPTAYVFDDSLWIAAGKNSWPAGPFLNDVWRLTASSSMASLRVTSFEDRTGTVYSASGDYTATEVTLAPTGEVAATDVQAGIAELASEKVSIAKTETISGAKTFDNGKVGVLTLGGLVPESETALIRFLTGSKHAFAIGAQHNAQNAFEITPSTQPGGTTFSKPALTINASRDTTLFGRVGILKPPAAGVELDVSGDIVASGTLTVASCKGCGVQTVFGRAGTVAAMAGDYTATEVTLTPTGEVAANNVQAGIAELGSKMMSITKTETISGIKTFDNGLIGLLNIGGIKPKAETALIRFLTGSSAYAFAVGAEHNAHDTFEITPSTAAGGATFSKPALTISASRDTTLFGRVGILKPPAAGVELDVSGDIVASGTLTVASCKGCGSVTAATEVTLTPTGDVAANNVQAGIAELGSKMMSITKTETISGIKTFDNGLVGLLNIGGTQRAAETALIRFITGSSAHAFALGAEYNAHDTFEITPSTVAGGAVFSKPAFTIKASGDARVSGSLVLGASDNSADIGSATLRVKTVYPARIITGASTPTMSGTGGGYDATYVLDAGSSDHAGYVIIAAGTTPLNMGSATVTFSTVGGAYGTNKPVCIASLLDGTGSWNAAATVRVTSASPTAVTFGWKNGSEGLFSDRSTYLLGWNCTGK